jgi:hypothetical protein
LYLHRSPSSLLPSDNLTSSSTNSHSFHFPQIIRLTSTSFLSCLLLLSAALLPFSSFYLILFSTILLVSILHMFLTSPSS